MNIFQSKEVVTPIEEKLFLNVVDNLYKNDVHWVRPLDNEIKKIFDRKKNKRFLKGDAIRWILLDYHGKTCARIAAFYDNFTASSHKQPTGGIGFFECINNQKAANMLFDLAKSWLTSKGIQAMDGPINFGNRDYFWGCLSDGVYQPIFNMQYNHLYYNKLFTNYGFKNYFNQYTYHLKLDPKLLSPILRYKADRLKRDPSFTFTNYLKSSGDSITTEFSEVFNKAWAHFPGVEPINQKKALSMFQSLKPLIDERLIIIARHDGIPIGFFIMIPDINQIIQSFHGKLNSLNKLRLLWALRIQKKCHRVIGLIFGVIPEFQGKGIEAGLVMKFEENVQTKGFPYTDLEMNWIGDFNPTMMKLVSLIGGQIYKTHITYRYLFDKKMNFERAPLVNTNN